MISKSDKTKSPSSWLEEPSA